MDDLIVRYVNLPCAVRGLTVMDSDENYNVYINAKMAHNIQHRALKHELEHIKRKHFGSLKPVRELEKEATQLKVR